MLAFLDGEVMRTFHVGCLEHKRNASKIDSGVTKPTIVPLFDVGTGLKAEVLTHFVSILCK